MTELNGIECDDKGLLVSCSHCGKRNRMTYERLGEMFRCGNCQQELPLPNQPVEVTSSEAFEALTAHSGLPVVVDFWAEWCPPCRMMGPQFHQAAEQGAGRFVAAKVNTGQLPELAEKFQITGIPTLILFKDGRIAARQSGAMNAGMIRRFVEG